MKTFKVSANVREPSAAGPMLDQMLLDKEPVSLITHGEELAVLVPWELRLAKFLKGHKRVIDALAADIRTDAAGTLGMGAMQIDIGNGQDAFRYLDEKKKPVAILVWRKKYLDYLKE